MLSSSNPSLSLSSSSVHHHVSADVIQNFSISENLFLSAKAAFERVCALEPFCRALEPICVTIFNQKQVLSVILAQLQEREGLVNEVVSKKTEREELYTSLESILTQLKSSRVPVQLKAPNSDAEDFLFDFVDEEAVKLILFEATDSRSKVYAVATDLLLLLSDMRQRILHFVSLVESSQIPTLPHFESVRMKIRALHQHYQRLTSIYLSMAGFHDKVCHHLDSAAASSHSVSLDQTSEEYQKFFREVAALSSDCDHLQLLCSQLEQDLHACQKYQDRCVAIYQQLSGLQTHIESQKGAIDSLLMTFEDEGARMSSCFSEIQGLASSYITFKKSCDVIGEELERREKQDKLNKKLMEDMQSHLDSLYEREKQQRAASLEQGPFDCVPSSLLARFNALLESKPVRYVIVARQEETESGTVNVQLPDSTSSSATEFSKERN
eukprot:GILI01023146.1.p1 GENE.GILI01023146.1~~GILI01023146.1.p1  ORF type:complete len:439 (+),score=60.87 GILI01023146.1:181-1497(+)